MSQDPAVGGGRGAASRLQPPVPIPHRFGENVVSCLRRAAWILPCMGDLMSLTSSPMSPRRFGSVPWVTRRPPYAILPIIYGSRRPSTFEAAPSRCPSCNRTSSPPTPAAFLNSGALQTGRCLKKTCDGGYGAISPPIAPPPPPCPPLGLLP